jgi:NADPH2:quinone reductase
VKRIETTGAGGPEVLVLREAEAPRAAPGDVVIEVFAAGVNRPDVVQREGRYPPPPGASPILGLEVAGVVHETGDGSGWKKGDRVCALVPGGGYAEYCAVPGSSCLPIPSGLSMEEAAGIPETFFTVWANVFQIGALARGERFLVHGGTSGIGTTAIQLGREWGAEVFATAGSPEKCAAALRLGASHAIDYRATRFEAEIARLTEGGGVDLVLDMVGGDYVDRDLSCLAPRGRIVVIATQGGAQGTIHLGRLMQKRATITGSTMRPRTVEDKAVIARELRERVWPLIESGKVKPVLDSVFPLEAAAEAHRRLESGSHVGKIVLRVRKES